MVAVSADAEELARLDLAHRRIVNRHRVRYEDLLSQSQRHLSTAVEQGDRA